MREHPRQKISSVAAEANKGSFEMRPRFSQINFTTRIKRGASARSRS